ncbi:MAG: helix-turn-helix transcriptional regulator [Clostridia bacterium]|nr:helix-turn-helix transcriptional regulator [Clostridia bacterium]
MNNRIRALRKAQGLTLKELGAIVDLAESTISQYETGKRQPDNETLLRLGKYFGVSIDYILGGETPIAIVPLDEFTFSMQKYIEDLTEQDKTLLVQLAQRLAIANKYLQKVD